MKRLIRQPVAMKAVRRKRVKPSCPEDARSQVRRILALPLFLSYIHIGKFLTSPGTGLSAAGLTGWSELQVN